MEEKEDKKLLEKAASKSDEQKFGGILFTQKTLFLNQQL